MGKRYLEVAVYPLLVVNLALGFLMFTTTHQLILVLSDVLHRGGLLENLGPFSYVQRSLSSFGVVILGLLTLIFFSTLESYYMRGTERSRLLLRRFLRVVGIQLLYLGIVQLAARLIIGVGADASMLLIIAQLAAGLGLVIFATARVFALHTEE